MTEEDTESDEALMAAIRLGDKGAFTCFYDRHAPHAYSLAAKITDCQADAESVVSDVFFEVWRKPDRFDESRGACRAYLLMLTRSRAIDRLRAAATHSRKVADAADQRADERRRIEASQSPYAPLLALEQQQQVHAAVATLSPEQREPLQMSFFGGLTHKQIAEQLEEPLGTIKTRIRSGLQKLRTVLTPSVRTPQEESDAVP